MAVWEGTTGKGAPGVQRIVWSDSRPAVFFVLDDASKLHVWDLLANDSVRAGVTVLLDALAVPHACVRPPGTCTVRTAPGIQRPCC